MMRGATCMMSRSNGHTVGRAVGGKEQGGGGVALSSAVRASRTNAHFYRPQRSATAVQRPAQNPLAIACVNVRCGGGGGGGGGGGASCAACCFVCARFSTCAPPRAPRLHQRAGRGRVRRRAPGAVRADPMAQRADASPGRAPPAAAHPWSHSHRRRRRCLRVRPARPARPAQTAGCAAPASPPRPAMAAEGLKRQTTQTARDRARL